MSVLQNESLLETIYEEVMEELIYATETFHKYSEKEIESIVYQRFEEKCQ